MSIFAVLIKGGYKERYKERTKSSEMEALETEQGSKCSDFFAIDFLWMNCTTIINVAM